MFLRIPCLPLLSSYFFYLSYRSIHENVQYFFIFFSAINISKIYIQSTRKTNVMAVQLHFSSFFFHLVFGFCVAKSQWFIHSNNLFLHCMRVRRILFVLLLLVLLLFLMLKSITRGKHRMNSGKNHLFVQCRHLLTIFSLANTYNDVLMYADLPHASKIFTGKEKKRDWMNNPNTGNNNKNNKESFCIKMMLQKRKKK